MNNNLYEFGGLCDVIIRCASERTIGGKTYRANEPYTLLEGVYVDLQYATKNSEQSGKTTVLSSREGFPDFINIRGLTLTDKINNLIANRIEPKSIGKVYDGIAYGGVIYLPEKASDTEIFVYKRNELFSATMGQNMDCIYGDFEEGETYKIFYNALVGTHAFDLEMPHYGYFTLEIKAKGNTDKITESVYMKFPACSLIAVPVFNFIGNNILNAPLRFQCIYKNQIAPYFAFER